MAPGPRCSAKDRQTQRYLHAANHPISGTVRISQPYHRSRAGRRDRIFPARFPSFDRRRALHDLIVDLVSPNQELLIDAYCGAGFFAKALLDKFERVIGIDWDRFAIAAAKENATSKETYIAGDVESELQQVGAVAPGFRSKETTLLVDPPATGLSAAMRKAIVDLAPATLIYVSCNPATLARDLKELQGKFTINSVTPLDMFPQTAEFEVAVQLHA